MNIHSFKYIPIIKTTDAELKGIKNLENEVKSKILPVFELTRSRKSKNNQDAIVEKRMESLKNVFGNNRPFILDITSHQDLANEQIIQFGDETDGFANWCEFVESYKNILNIIPVIHMYPKSENVDHDIEAQIKRLANNFDYLAFRFLPFSFEEEDGIPEKTLLIKEFLEYITLISSTLSLNRLILIIDAQYVDSALLKRKIEYISELITAIPSHQKPIITSITSSSFPIYVVGHESTCKDSEGVITMLEKKYFKEVCSNLTNTPVIYGDYASIHPFRSKQQGGGNWVPRIDFPLSNTTIYTRYRRDDGGYIECAIKMHQKTEFSQYNNFSWGREMIINAKNGEPEGKSPSFWISVRLNLHISRLIQDNELPA